MTSYNGDLVSDASRRLVPTDGSLDLFLCPIGSFRSARLQFFDMDRCPIFFS
ncbi:hypothetical protein Baya_9902 [Bagarius yarrelli]|uniref:Uncharacterized protein n=1 Tax=Bagarius yarrelli TaxID=175774 RepID=A0A556U8Y8_BAGYA|nr:hypothetical protein Baya_9902 [Bagarius yarrelli]